MIKLTLQFGGENFEVVIRGDELLFFDVSSGSATSIEGLQLSKSGCIKEFLDLEGNEDWRKETIKRFKQKMKTYNSEMGKMEYIKLELEKHVYESLYFQRAGFRPQKFREESK
jgi:hypothetical protein